MRVHLLWLSSLAYRMPDEMYCYLIILEPFWGMPLFYLHAWERHPSRLGNFHPSSQGSYEMDLLRAHSV